MRIITFTADDRNALAHDRYHHPDPAKPRPREAPNAQILLLIVCAHVATEAYPKSHPVKQKTAAWQKTWPLVQHSPDRWNKNVDGPTRRR